MGPDESPAAPAGQAASAFASAAGTAEALRASLGFLPVAVMTLDRDGHILIAEGGLFAQLGHPAEALIGHSLLNAPWVPMWLRRAALSALGGKEVRERGTLAKDQALQAVLRPITDGDGDVTGALCLLHEHPELPSTPAERFRALGELVPGVFWEADVDPLRLTDVSSAASALLGIPPSEWLGGDFWSRWVHPDDRSEVAKAQAAALAGEGPVQVEYRLRHPHGCSVWVRDHLTATEGEGGRRRLRGVMFDESGLRASLEAKARETVLLHATLEATQDAVLAVDLSGRPLAFNQCFLDLWRIPRTRLGESDESDLLIHALQQLEDPQSFVERVLHLYTQPEEDGFDTLRFKDGRILERYSRPMSLDGVLAGRVWTFRDATAQHQNEEERWRLLAEAQRARAEAEAAARRAAVLSEASRRLATSLDAEQTLHTVARVAIPMLSDGCAVFLLGRGEYFAPATTAHWDAGIERTAKELFQRFPPDPQLPVGMGRVAQTGESLFLEDVPDEFLQQLARGPEHLEYLRKLRMRSYIAVPLIAHGRVLGVLALSTLQRRFSQADLRTAEELGRRCAAALEHASLYQEAQKAVRLRDDFLAVAAHELRTPLTPLTLLLGSLAVHLRKGTGRPLELVERAQRSVGRLKMLVGDLLDASRIDSGRLLLRHEPFDLGILLAEVVEDFREGAPTHLYELERPQSPLPVRADRSRLEQVMVNLIANAVKYSPAGSVITVVALRRTHGVEFSVSDQGIGIPREQQGAIFDKYVRAATAPVERYGGLGLGLFICKSVVEQFGGRIEVESERDRGSRFTVTLPLDRAEPASER